MFKLILIPLFIIGVVIWTIKLIVQYINLRTEEKIEKLRELQDIERKELLYLENALQDKVLSAYEASKLIRDADLNEIDKERMMRLRNKFLNGE